MSAPSSLYPIEPATPITVRQAVAQNNEILPGQFWLEGRSAGRHFDEQYVNFCGYFGSYGPYVFAAAPDLLAALKAIKRAFGNCGRSPFEQEACRLMDEAIAKAEGGAA